MTSKNGQKPVRKLAAGGDPHQTYPSIPTEKKFDAESTKFLSAGDLEQIAKALAGADPDVAYALRFCEVRYLWKREGGTDKGSAVLGRCVKPSGLAHYFASADIVIWLASDHLRAMRAGSAATRWQVEAALYHELKHIGVEEDEDSGEMRPVTLPHDIEAFNAEIIRYGPWKSDVAAAAAAFTQMPLFADDELQTLAPPTAPVREFVDDISAMVDDPASGVNSISVTAGGRTATIAGKRKKRS